MSIEITPAFKKAVRAYLDEHPRTFDNLAWEYNDFYVDDYGRNVKGMEDFYQMLHDVGPIDAFEIGQGCPDFNTEAPYFRYDKYANPHSLTEAQAKKAMRESALEDDVFYEDVADGNLSLDRGLEDLVKRFEGSKNAKPRTTAKRASTARKPTARKAPAKRKTTGARR